ncbi:MAG TPA: hypothetical protein VF532_14555 [Candidatus Angelobacter sp.]
MKPESTTTTKTTIREFRVPIELLKVFKNDPRSLPHVIPSTGWITFDLDMLTSVLRHGNPQQREDLAKGVEALKLGGGNMVLMGMQTEEFK